MRFLQQLERPFHGRYLVRLGFCLWAAFNFVLQIAHADFTASDSAVLADIRSSIVNLEIDSGYIRGDVRTVVSQLVGVATSLSNVESDFVDVVDYLDDISRDTLDLSQDVDAIRDAVITIRDDMSSSGNFFHKLEDIEASIDSVSVNITNVLVSSITNAIASLPKCSCLATNFVGGVDLSIVTNFLLISQLFSEAYTWGSVADYNPLLADFVSWFYGGGDWSDPIDWGELFVSTPLGLSIALVDSALRPRSHGTTLWRIASTYWFDGYDSLDATWPYTIFDAYNTIFITNLLQTIDNRLVYGVMVTNTLEQPLYVTFTNDLVDVISRSSATANAIANAVGTAPEEGEETPLDYEANAQLPEWEPSYADAIADNTNGLYYVQQADQMTSRLFLFTNTFYVLKREFDRDKSEEFKLDLTFSGVSTQAGNKGGWSMELALPENTQDESRYIVALWHLFWNFANVVIFLTFAIRIHRFVTSPMAVT